MFDIDAIDTMPEYQLTKEERADFLTLFNQVSVEGTKTLEEHEEKIQEAWIYSAVYNRFDCSFQRKKDNDCY